MLWIIILIIAAIILYNVIKSKLEDRRIKKNIEIRNQRRDELEKKANRGDSVAQVELSNWYLDEWRRYNLDSELKMGYYWRWVAVYNGFHTGAVNAFTDNMNQFIPMANGSSSQSSLAAKVLRTMKKAEEEVYRDRKLYKERFPMDVGDNPQVKELHEMIKQWNY
ncbi:MAG: hypothetical protein IJE43_16620 [Alphaproteobacteria bacterium]|nr:hypothetical protein [Alphaproteobacteria bacterium]